MSFSREMIVFALSRVYQKRPRAVVFYGGLKTVVGSFDKVSIATSEILWDLLCQYRTANAAMNTPTTTRPESFVSRDSPHSHSGTSS